MHSELKLNIQKCDACRRRTECKAPVSYEMSPEVKVRADVLFVGQGIGVVEDTEGRPFAGGSGKMLRSLLAELPTKKWVITNATLCYGGGKPIELDELHQCSRHTEALIAETKPEVVVCLGFEALRTIASSWVDEEVAETFSVFIGRHKQVGGVVVYAMNNPAAFARASDYAGWAEQCKALKKFLSEQLVVATDLGTEHLKRFLSEEVVSEGKDLYSAEIGGSRLMVLAVKDSNWKSYHYPYESVQIPERELPEPPAIVVVFNHKLNNCVSFDVQKVKSSEKSLGLKYSKVTLESIKSVAKECLRPKREAGNFVHLHVHTEYSMLDAVGKMSALLDEAENLGFRAMAITDHGTLAGAVKFYDECRKRNIRPILGIEVYVCDDIADPEREQKHHLTLYAQNLEGWKNLLMLDTIAHIQGFRRKPLLDYKTLDTHNEGVVATTGCPTTSKYCRDGDLHKKLAGIYGDRLWVEVMPNELDDTKEMVRFAEYLWTLDSRKWRPLATNDVHYPREEDMAAQEVLLAIRSHSTMADEKRWKYETTGHFLRTREEMLQAFKSLVPEVSDAFLSEALDNTVKFADAISFDIPKSTKAELPAVSVPEGYTADSYLRLLCQERAIELGLQSKYLDRMELELSRIEKLGFSPLFLIVSDMLRWARKQGIQVGAARGCFLPGSLVKVRAAGVMYGDKPPKSYYQGHGVGHKGRFKKALISMSRDVPIERVRVGMGVLTHDTTYQKVVDCMEFEISEECVEVVLENGRSIRCTSDHRLMTSRGWIEAGLLGPGDNLLSPRIPSERIDIACIDCGKARRLCIKDIRAGKGVRCLACANKAMAITAAGRESRRKGGAYWKTQLGRTRMSKIISRKMKDGLRDKVAEGTRLAQLRDPTIQIRAAETRWRNNREHPEVIDKMQRSYNYGYFWSEKCERIVFYQSSYEKKALQVLEEDTSVSEFGRFSTVIPYEFHGKTRYYKPDFWFKRTDGSTVILEVKAAWFIESRNEVFAVKSAAAEELVNSNIFSEFLVWTEKELGIMNDILHRESRVLEVRRFWYEGKVYDLTVDRAHNYTVSGVSVHNSVAGSLTAYLTDITAVDPLKYDLLFDRFISEERIDLPDIDIDIEDGRREEVKQYLRDKYGHVCGVATYGEFHGKMALADAAKIYGVSELEIRAVTRHVIARSVGDSRADYTVSDALEQFGECQKFNAKHPEVFPAAAMLEGQVKYRGKHAAGFWLSSVPITEKAPVYKVVGKDGKDEFVTAFDMYAGESLGLLKLDLLGLRTLTVMRHAKELVKERHGIELDFNSVDLAEPEVYKAFCTGLTAGVFQFSTKGLTKLLRDMQPTEFKELVEANSLYRPGALNSGLTRQYVLDKMGIEFDAIGGNKMIGRKTEAKKVYPLYDAITADTRGIVLYQEQVMQIMYQMAGYPWKTADMIRKVMSKSQGVARFNTMREDFVKRCVAKGVSKSTATEVFDMVYKFGSFSFNKSHSVSYALVGYWMMWLKCHYPLEYYTAVISHEIDDMVISECMREAKDKFGIDIMPPLLNKSRVEAAIEGEGIRLGYKHIKGMGETTCDELSKLPHCDSFLDFVGKVNRRVVNRGKIASLLKIGFFDGIEPRAGWIADNLEQVLDKKKIPVDTSSGGAYNDKATKELIPHVQDNKQMDILKSKLKELNPKLVISRISDLGVLSMRPRVLLGGVVTFINFKQEGLEGMAWFSKTLERKYVHLNVADETDFVLGHVPPDLYTRAKLKFERNPPFGVLLSGYTRPSHSKVYVDGLTLVDEFLPKIQNGMEGLTPFEHWLVDADRDERTKKLRESLCVSCLRDINTSRNTLTAIGTIVRVHEKPSQHGTWFRVTIEDDTDVVYEHKSLGLQSEGKASLTFSVTEPSVRRYYEQLSVGNLVVARLAHIGKNLSLAVERGSWLKVVNTDSDIARLIGGDDGRA